MSYELDGNIKIIGETASFGAKGFIKRELVVTTTSDRFPQDIKFEFVKDKTALLDGYQIGQMVRVSFDIRGGEYNGKYFVNLTGWKIEASDGSGAREASSQGGQRQGGGGGGGNQQRPRPAAKKPEFNEEDFNQQSREEYPF